jgi:hypothetical protein
VSAGRDEPFRPVGPVEEVLSGLGVAETAFDARRSSAGDWFADWSGPIGATADVYLGIMTADPVPTVRLMLDDWLVEDVVKDDLAELIRRIFTGRAGMAVKPGLLRRDRLLTLKVEAGGHAYESYRRARLDEVLEPWEQALIDGT